MNRYLTIFILLFFSRSLPAVIGITGVTHSERLGTIDLCRGAIDLTANGNAGPFTFSWSNGATTEDIGDLCAGEYTVTVTNAFGCNWIFHTTIGFCQSHGNPLNPLIDITDHEIIDPDPYSLLGSIDITVETGNTPVTGLYYQWTDAATNTIVGTEEDLHLVPPGQYCVSITNGCSSPVTQCFTLEKCSYAHPEGAFRFTFDKNKPCPKSNNGMIELSVSGVPGPYTYQWQWPNGSVTQNEDLDHAVAGVYRIRVTDANQCSYTEEVTLLNAIESIEITHLGQHCSSSQEGFITVRPLPDLAEGQYQYTWSNGATGSGPTHGVEGLAAGHYCVTVTEPDANCSLSRCVDISDGLPVDEVMIDKLSFDKSCTDEICEGEVRLSVNSANTNLHENYSVNIFNYNLSGQNGQNQTNTAGRFFQLCHGHYNIVVSDYRGCTAQKEVDICCCGTTESTQPDQPECLQFYEAENDDYAYKPTPTSILISQPTPENNFLGSIDINFDPEFENDLLLYRWTKVGDPDFHYDQQFLRNVPAGTYCLTASTGCHSTDIGCYTLAPYCIFTVKPSCVGGQNGKVIFQFDEEADFPLQIEWSGGVVTCGQSGEFSLTGLPSGNYEIKITDNAFISFTVNVTIKEERSKIAYDPPMDDLINSQGGADLNILDWVNRCDHWGDWGNNEGLDLYNHRIKINQDFEFNNPGTLIITWPDEETSEMVIDEDGNIDINGKSSYEVTEFGRFSVVIEDLQGCKAHYCIPFGNDDIFIPNRAVSGVVSLPGSDLTVFAYHSCQASQNCGTDLCPTYYTSPAPESLGSISPFIYLPHNRNFPCRDGGVIEQRCGNFTVSTIQEIFIPASIPSQEFIDFSHPISQEDGVCEYLVGCLFEYPPPYSEFHEQIPVYVETSIFIENPNCISPPEGDPADPCFGGGIIETLDQESCTGVIICNDTETFISGCSECYSEVYGTDSVNLYYYCPLTLQCCTVVPHAIRIPKPFAIPQCPYSCAIARPSGSNRSNYSTNIQPQHDISLTVYPNPTNSRLYLFFNPSTPKGLNINLYDAVGIKVLIKRIDDPNELQRPSIDLTNHSSGIYFLHITDDDGTVYVKKIVKN